MIEFTEDLGNNAVYVKIENIDRFTRFAIERGWYEFGQDLKRTTSKDILKRPKGGRTYIIRGPSGRRRRHVASAPGETHANRSGRLRRSLSFKIRGWSELEFGYLNDPPKHDRYVEKGTSRMKARPSLRNNITKLIRNGQTTFERTIVSSLK